MKTSIKLIFAFFLCVSMSLPVRAEETSTTEAVGTRKQLATIIFCGLGGAILGLSTLSFYGRPQDYMANIAIGFAAGIFIGTGVVTVKAINGTAESYELENSRSLADQKLSTESPQLHLAWSF